MLVDLGFPARTGGRVPSGCLSINPIERLTEEIKWHPDMVDIPGAPPR